VELINKKWRVNGCLSVSRAFGDMELKPIITALPDICTYTMDGSERFLCLSCNGLYNVMSPEEIAEFINNCQMVEMSVTEITKALQTEAVNRNIGSDLSSMKIF
jgi:serine/threonine protein phosphatase PrpC